MEFHKTAQVLLTAGDSQRITLYQVDARNWVYIMFLRFFLAKIDGKDNPKLQEMAIDRFPIDSAHFSASGERVYAGSRLHAYFFYYDMLEGKVVRIPANKSKPKYQLYILS